MEKVDLTYIKSISADNKELLIEMIDIFKSQVTEFIDEINKCLQGNDWMALSRIAHKAKSSATIVGLDDLSKNLKSLELDAKEEKGTYTYKDRVDYINTSFLDAVAQLNIIIKTL